MNHIKNKVSISKLFNGMCCLFLITFFILSLLFAATAHAQCTSTGPIADCFEHTTYYTPELTSSPVDPFCKPWASPGFTCSGSFYMAVYLPAESCPTEITFDTTCSGSSVSVMNGEEIENLLASSSAPMLASLSAVELREGKNPVIVQASFTGGGSGTANINVYCRPCPITATADPIPDIKVNDSDGPLSLIDNLLVTVALDPGSHSGENVDWWVAADTPLGWFYLDAGTMSWVFVGASLTNLLVTHQGPLFNLSTIEVLNIPVSGLSSGTHTFYFAIDTVANGVLDLGSIFFDLVKVVLP